VISSFGRVATVLGVVVVPWCISNQALVLGSRLYFLSNLFSLPSPCLTSIPDTDTFFILSCRVIGTVHMETVKGLAAATLPFRFCDPDIISFSTRNVLRGLCVPASFSIV